MVYRLNGVLPKNIVGLIVGHHPPTQSDILSESRSSPFSEALISFTFNFLSQYQLIIRIKRSPLKKIKLVIPENFFFSKKPVFFGSKIQNIAFRSVPFSLKWMNFMKYFFGYPIE